MAQQRNILSFFSSPKVKPARDDNATCARSDDACKDAETASDSENDAKTSSKTRQRARVISSSSDEDENESNDQQTNSSVTEVVEVQPETVHGIPFRTTARKHMKRQGEKAELGPENKRSCIDSAVADTRGTDGVVTAANQCTTAEQSDTSVKSETAKPPVHSFFAPRKPAAKPDNVTAIKSDRSSSSVPTVSQTDDDADDEDEADAAEAGGKSSPGNSSRHVNQSNSTNDAGSGSKKSQHTIKLSSPSKKSSSSSSDENYDPAKSQYNPVKDACWSESSKVPYLCLAKTFEAIEKVSARLKSIEILSNLFRSVIALSPDNLLHCVYLCLNRLAPAYEAIELGIGETILLKAIAHATGRTVEHLKKELQQKGDIGLVAESSRSKQQTMFVPAKLTVVGVFSQLRDIASMSGNAVMSKKTDKIRSLFVACRQCEARYLMRSLSGKLRIGLAEQSVLYAIAQAVIMTPPTRDLKSHSVVVSVDSVKPRVDHAAYIVKSVYSECPNYNMIIPLLLTEKLEDLPNKCKLTPGIPLKPMLAHPTKGIHEVMQRFGSGEFVCEYKYDGERAQIHVLDDGSVRVFSRNQEDNTNKYPDIVRRMQTMMSSLQQPVTSAVIDSEAVAWDRQQNCILPFQELSKRKRKDASESDIKVQVCIYAFDLLYINGESMVSRPFRHRRDVLKSSFPQVEGEFMFASSLITNDTDRVAEFIEESIKGNCEGLMVKTLDADSTYEIAKRSHNWLKLKKDYLEGVGDTLDLVVVGGYHGAGKRAGRYGGFLLACYDDVNEEYQTICKIGTGFSDSDLEQHSSFLREHVIKKAKPYYRFDVQHEPDVWFDAVQVWEVKAADLSISPTHCAAAGLVDSEKGISLRFPRFLRIRDDKSVESATSSQQVAEMYRSQEQIVNQMKKKMVADADEDID